MIRAEKALFSGRLLEVWCDELDVEKIFALDCIAAITPVNLKYELAKQHWYHVLVDARYDPEDAMRQIEALDIEIPEVFKEAWPEIPHSPGDSNS